MNGLRPLEGAEAIVLGLGRFGGGLGAARWLVSQGARVTITDRSPAGSLGAAAAEAATLDAQLVLGGHEGVDFTAADLLVVNPAVPLDAPPVLAAAAAGVEITSEIALLMERWPGPVLGVTGSNGKSTTVTLAGAVLEALDVPVVVGGNIGGSLLSRLGEVPPRTVAVLELSSFMLELLVKRRLGPEVAVVTNLTPNHLDRHGTMEAYAAAKAGILVAAHTAVLNGDDPATLALARGFGGRRLLFGGARPEIDLGVDPRGRLVDAQGRVRAPDGGRWLPGRAHRLDLAAAGLAVGALVDDLETALAALPSAVVRFRPPPHRLALVARHGGIQWIDDSVSTTPESTAASLEGIKSRCLLIAGGHDKGLDPTPLVEAARHWTRLVLTIGEQGAPLAERLNQRGVPAEQVHTVEAAVERAARLARAGETVLLSPGYSSHDQFRNYEHRAEVFVHAVARLARTQGLSRPATGC